METRKAKRTSEKVTLLDVCHQAFVKLNPGMQLYIDVINSASLNNIRVYFWKLAKSDGGNKKFRFVWDNNKILVTRIL